MSSFVCFEVDPIDPVALAWERFEDAQIELEQAIEAADPARQEKADLRWLRHHIKVHNEPACTLVKRLLDQY